MKKLRVLIADDHAVMRYGIRKVLEDEADIEVVGEAADGREAVEQATSLRPDVVIMDVSMPGTNGMEATRQIRDADESVQVLGLTVHGTNQYFFSMLEAGAAGYLLKKDATSEELAAAVRSVHANGVYLHPTVAKWLMEDRLNRKGSGSDTVEGLTPRETEVLKLLADGYSNADIAEMLGVSPATVQTHRSHILQKLDLHSRADLVRYAVSKGLIEIDTGG